MSSLIDRVQPHKPVPEWVREQTGDFAFLLDPAASVNAYHALTGALEAEGFTHHGWYAVKCNPHPDLIRRLARAGCGFEAASCSELGLLSALGVDVAEVPFTNPIRSIWDSTQALNMGVRKFTVDSVGEAQRLSQAAAQAGVAPDTVLVSVRVATASDQAQWDLSGKFGVSSSTALAVVEAVLAFGFTIWAVSFHVGSQTMDSQAWADGLHAALPVVTLARAAGADPQVIDIGGGFPVSYASPDPSADAAAVNQAIYALGRAFDQFPELRHLSVAVEPGRFLAAPAGRYLTSVIGSADRLDGRWVYTTVGAYNGPTESRELIGKVPFPVLHRKASSQLLPTTLTGPTCDASDTLARGVLLPADLADGDPLEFIYAGAYSLALSSAFNGFAPPPVFVVTEEGTVEWENSNV